VFHVRVVQTSARDRARNTVGAPARSRRAERRGVPLRIGDVRNVDAALSIGALEESITVEASVPVLNTSDSTVGTVISNDHITALPLNGRNYSRRCEMRQSPWMKKWV
jgi:hypothetical protein